MLNAVTGGVYPVRNLAGAALKVETGTMSSQRLEYAQTVQNRMDRTAGFSDAQRGRAAGKTATESQIVQANADLRTEWMRQQVARALRSVLRKVGWYLFYDHNVVMELSIDNPLGGPPLEATYLGGMQPGQVGMDWVDFNLDFDASSLGRGDDAVQQQRWLQILGLVPQIYQLLQMPGVNVRWLVDRLGNAMGQSRLAEVLFGDLLGKTPNMMPMQPSRPAMVQGMGPGGSGFGVQGSGFGGQMAGGMMAAGAGMGGMGGMGGGAGMGAPMPAAGRVPSGMRAMMAGAGAGGAQPGRGGRGSVAQRSR